MFKVEIDYLNAQQVAQSLGAAADQVPYAIALALNRSAEVTRTLLIRQTWPGAIHARNASFIGASLTTREARASKSSLSVEIYDKLNRGNLQLQAKGGSRVPRTSGTLAIPASDITRTAHGVPKRLRPKNLKTAVRKGNLLFARDGKGRLKLLYALKPATRVPKRVPFYEDFYASMARELKRTLPMAVEKAMRTRR
jgi:hypothetical protein